MRGQPKGVAATITMLGQRYNKAHYKCVLQSLMENILVLLNVEDFD